MIRKLYYSFQTSTWFLALIENIGHLFIPLMYTPLFACIHILYKKVWKMPMLFLTNCSHLRFFLHFTMKYAVLFTLRTLAARLIHFQAQLTALMQTFGFNFSQQVLHSCSAGMICAKNTLAARNTTTPPTNTHTPT